MCNLYENINALCNERNITPGGLCSKLGFRRSVLSDLKSGRKKSLDTTTLVKIASYFGVSVDYLLGTEKEKAPIPKDEREIGFDDFTYALNKEVKELTESDKALLLSLARQFNNARKQGDGKKTD